MVDSIIRLYPSDETRFQNNGIGTLGEATSAIVTEEKNGIYELELEYPNTGRRFSDIELGRIITCKVNPYDDAPQPFRIYSLSKAINGIVTVYAQHISYDLLGHVIAPFNTVGWERTIDDPEEFDPDHPVIVDGDILSAVIRYLNAMEERLLETKTGAVPFKFYNRTSRGGTFEAGSDVMADIPASIRSTIGDGDGSLLGLFGGEIEYDKFDLTLWAKRGSETGVRIRYGKNMMDITHEGSCATCYTSVFPYYKYTKSGNTVVQVLNDKAEHPEAPLVPINRDDFYDGAFFDKNVNVLPLDFSQKDIITSQGEAAIVRQIRELTNLFIESNKIGQPAFNITVSYRPMSDSVEYKAYRALESVRLCDWVTVEHDSLGIQNLAQVVKISYDILNNRYDSLDLLVNSEQKSISKTIASIKYDASSAIDGVKDDVDIVKEGVDDVKTDVSGVKTDVNNVKSDVDDVKTDVENVKIDVDTANQNASEALGQSSNAINRANEATAKADKSITRQRYLYSNHKGSSLPGEYEQVKYVKSDGLHYLDLGIKPSENLNIKVEIDGGFSKKPDSTETNPTLFGYSKSGKYCSFNDPYLNYGSSTNNKWVDDDEFVASNVSSVDILDSHIEVTIDIDGVKTVHGYNFQDTVGVFSGDGNLYFGADNNDGTARRYSVAKFTKITAYHDYVPAYNPETGKSGMFDMSDKIFYPVEGWTHGDIIGSYYPPVPEGARPSSEWDIPSGYTQYWSTRIPAPKANMPYFICREYQCGDGSVYYTDVMEDTNNTALLSWCKGTGTVLIDGGMIAANTIAADKIIANDLMANGIETGILASREFIESGGTQGMAVNLTTGEILANNGKFKLSSSGRLKVSEAFIGNLYLDLFGNLTGISPDGLTEVLVGSNSLDGDTAKVYVGTKISQGSAYLETHPLNAVIIKHGRIRILTETTEGKRISKYEIFGSDMNRGTYRYSEDFYESVGDWREQIANEEASFGYYPAPSLEETFNDFDERIRTLEDRITALES